MLRMSTMMMVLTALAGFSWADSAEESSIRILQPTMYHGDEINAKTGETWWGLYPDGEGFTLRPTVITVESVHDVIVDEEGQATGKQISVTGKERPVLLVQGLSNPKEGPVTTAFSGSRFVFPGDSEALTVNWIPNQKYKDSGDMFHLSAIGSVIGSRYGPTISDYKLILYKNLWNGKGEKQQFVSTNRCDMDGRPVLLWAGDLDNDGQLDLLMDLTDHYNVTAITLFLSTCAKEGEIVGKAAELISVGC